MQGSRGITTVCLVYKVGSCCSVMLENSQTSELSPPGEGSSFPAHWSACLPFCLPQLIVITQRQIQGPKPGPAKMFFFVFFGTMQSAAISLLHKRTRPLGPDFWSRSWIHLPLLPKKRKKCFVFLLSTRPQLAACGLSIKSVLVKC